eukprot:CAMPEP_0206124818 /NCGR_PEP_ID=MMETSP1472-20131121/14460_1 /ASSEMBLY_ACC=CAM_ASM_001108 /TAXON_ID=41880 /ORGANISM="Pycnococcus provasolii, Strain RCC251" /LENGTH=76 /DNA_ID=CAMNT_0053515663 /DNA_START=65 /DNA_END=295 /DNA_ORIENTATION=+
MPPPTCAGARITVIAELRKPAEEQCNVRNEATSTSRTDAFSKNNSAGTRLLAGVPMSPSLVLLWSSKMPKSNDDSK